MSLQKLDKHLIVFDLTICELSGDKSSFFRRTRHTDKTLCEHLIETIEILPSRVTFCESKLHTKQIPNKAPKYKLRKVIDFYVFWISQFQLYTSESKHLTVYISLSAFPRDELLF